MDGKRFDGLAIALAESASSRRSIMQRLGGGGLVAALTALGITGFALEDVEAKSCKKKCKKKKTAKKRRKCRKKCGGTGNGATGCAESSQCAGAMVCLNGICVKQCLDDNQCDGGICIGNNCVPRCTDTSDCNDFGGTSCLNGGCLVPCQSKSDCGSGEYCNSSVNGGCVAQPYVQMCVEPADCAFDYKCVDDICLLSCESSDDCLGDLECNSDSICVGGNCDSTSDCSSSETTEICLQENCVAAELFPQ